MASRPTLGPEADFAVEKAARTVRTNLELDGLPDDEDRELARATVQEFLTEASQSCPELLLRYALSEEARTALAEATNVRARAEPHWQALQAAHQKLEESLE